MRRIELRLERQYAQDKIGCRANAGDARLPPGPDLRANVLHGGDTSSFQGSLHGQIKIRRIDADEDIGSRGLEALDQAPAQSQQPWQVPQNFGQAHDRQFLGSIPGRTSCSRHPRAGDTEKLCVWSAPFNRLDQSCAKQVPGGLASR